MTHLADGAKPVIASWHGVPRLCLLTGPSPITRHPLESGGELLVKREDLLPGLAAGNKARKLEFLLARLLAAGARRVITVGAEGSHHVYNTALCASRAGLAARAVLFDRPPSEHSEAVAARTLPLLEVRPRVVGRTAMPFAVAAARLQCATDPETSWIPMGGSAPLGCLGLVRAVEELREQWTTAGLPEPGAAVVPLGTCGTAAGILAGHALVGWPVPLVAVRVVDRIVAHRSRVLRLARRTLALCRGVGLEPQMPLESVPLRIDHGRFGTAYGAPTPDSTRALERGRDLGLAIEPTYTAKALAAALEVAARPGAGPVLFWSTWDGVV